MLSISEMLDEGAFCGSPKECEEKRSDILYPQANSFEKVLGVIGTLRAMGMSVYDLVKTNIVHSSRQARYYYNAAAFLGFCYRRGDYFYPTDLANKLNTAPATMRRKMFAAMALRNPRIGVLYTGVFVYEDKEARIEWIEKQIAPCIVARATLRRRASCLHAWLAWIQQNLEKL